MAIENTAERDPIIHLLGSMSDGSDRYITGMESAGQRQLVNSDRLPTDLNGGSEADYTAVGFTFGDPDSRDDLFRPVTLPEGWKREGSGHAMWSYILDQHGRRRVSIFYKAAFYDRRAFMNLVTPVGYLNQVLWGEAELRLDDTWLTAQTAADVFDEIAKRYDKDAVEADELHQRAGRTGDYWTKRATEHRIRRDAAWEKRDKLRAVSS